MELRRADIDGCRNGAEIPVRILEREIPSKDKNGTLVEIEEIFLKQIDIPSMIRHIERHVAHWPDATVIVNHHECEFIEPDVHREYKFSTQGTEYEKLLGPTTLVVKVAKAPLDEELRGVAVLADGVWHETTLAGCDRKPFVEYLFGNIDVSALSAHHSDIPAFDMSRSMKLNPRNEVVGEMLRFIGVNLESVRKELEKQDRERRQTEEQKKLREQGSKIAELSRNGQSVSSTATASRWCWMDSNSDELVAVGRLVRRVARGRGHLARGPSRALARDVSVSIH